MHRPARLLCALALALALVLALPAFAQTSRDREPVRAIAPGRIAVATPEGSGDFPVYVSQDWTRPLPGVTRAVLVIHGVLRDADVYFADAQTALSAAGAAGAGALLVVPQFLADEDAVGRVLPAATLRWGRNDWPGGLPAHGPIPASSFDALDAVLARLAEPTLFPNLRTVVVAGHSAGGQVVQRYAVVVRGEAPLAARGIPVRYVVANPSSYLYFDDDRPLPDGGFAPFGGTACPRFNRWKYGFAADLPPYVSAAPAALERAYATRDVVYLLGAKDIDPHHPFLDTSCAGEAQGPTRYARGHAYFRLMQARNGGTLKQSVHDIAGVAHNGGRMFGSACGLAALFDAPGCAE